MNPDLATAIRAHIQKFELGDIEASALMCCETISTRQVKNLFGSKEEVVLTGVLLTPEWLVWATGKENETPDVLSARLGDIRVQDYETSDMFKMIEDSGLNVSGLRTSATRLGVTFIGLGPEAAADKFRGLLKDAIEKA
jgi:hypothetical protein